MSGRGISRSQHSGRSAAWLARLPWEQEAVGSNPAAPTEQHFPSVRQLLCATFTPARHTHEPRPVTTSTPPSDNSVPRFWPLFLVALGVRLGTVALGVWLASQPPQVIPPDDPATIEVRERIESGPGRILEPWFRWDAVWIANISRHGYAGATDRGGRLGVAFLPAMPASMAAAEAVGLNPFWFSILIANLVGAAGAAVLAQVAAHQLNERAAGWRTLALLLAFPTAFFFSAPYNESFGLLFTALVLAAWQANRAGAAGVCAFGGSLARLTGVPLGVAAGVAWLAYRARATPRRRGLVPG